MNGHAKLQSLMPQSSHAQPFLFDPTLLGTQHPAVTIDAQSTAGPEPYDGWLARTLGGVPSDNTAFDTGLTVSPMLTTAPDPSQSQHVPSFFTQTGGAVPDTVPPSTFSPQTWRGHGQYQPQTQSNLNMGTHFNPYPFAFGDPYTQLLLSVGPSTPVGTTIQSGFPSTFGQLHAPQPPAFQPSAVASQLPPGARLICRYGGRDYEYFPNNQATAKGTGMTLGSAAKSCGSALWTLGKAVTGAGSSVAGAALSGGFGATTYALPAASHFVTGVSVAQSLWNEGLYSTAWHLGKAAAWGGGTRLALNYLQG